MLGAFHEFRVARPHLKQIDIAKRCGINPAHLSHWLNGGSVPSSPRVDSQIEQLSALLGVLTADALATEMDSADPQEAAA
jgi:transcriptional regulator with XRE-family HTH domain